MTNQNSAANFATNASLGTTTTAEVPTVRITQTTIEPASKKDVSLSKAIAWFLGISEDKVSRGIKHLRLPTAVFFVSYCLHALYDESHFLVWFIQQIK